jgi:5-methylcytosine-specific restriction endonuclease McrBC GTP-binding regulatory subunit McrB
MAAVIWKDKQDVRILTNLHRPPTVDNFCNEQGKLKNLSLLQTTISTGSTLTRGTEWLMAVQSVGEHGHGKTNYFSNSWI